MVDGAGVDEDVLGKGEREKREREKREREKREREKNEPDGLERVHADEV